MGNYRVSRTVTINAPRERVHGLIEDLRKWVAWSPWEGLDPDLRRTYSGEASGQGAAYEWSGNNKAGAGSMRIRSATRDRIEIDVAFLKPFKSQSLSAFDLVDSGPDRTEVTWTMTGEQKGVWALLGKLMPMERFIGKDFDKGLAQLKTTAERPSSQSS